MAGRCGCGRTVTPSGACLECVLDVDECQCAPVEHAANVWAAIPAASAPRPTAPPDDVPLPADSYDDAPHPADDADQLTQHAGAVGLNGHGNLAGLILSQLVKAGPLGEHRSAFDRFGPGASAALDQLVAAGKVTRASGRLVAVPKSASVRVTRMSDVRPVRIKWLWPGYLPFGKVVLLDGDPDLGKSTLCLDLAARMTTGAPWPDGSASEPATVLLISAEDDKAATVRPRLDAAGADSKRVIYLDEIVTEAADGTKVERSPTIPNDLPTLEPMIAEHMPKLIIIDVLMAYLDGSVDGYRDQQVRQALIPLAKLAERYECCIIAIRHMTKTIGAKAIYRGGGSIGIIGAARAAFLVAEDSEDSTRRVFACHKMNIAPKPVALEYALEVDDLHGCGRIRWLGQSEYRADDLLNPASDEQRTAVDSAESWLRSYLAQEGGEADSKQVIEAGAKSGHSRRTLYRALPEAHVTSVDAGTFPRRTIWRLVTDSDEWRALQRGQTAPVVPGPEYGTTGAASGESSQVNPSFTVVPSPVVPNGLGTTVAATESDETADSDGGLCAGCGEPLAAVLVAAGFTTHGGDCDDMAQEKGIRK